MTRCESCGKLLTDETDYELVSRVPRMTVCLPCVKKQPTDPEFDKDVRDMQTVEILETIKCCSHESTRWLDCAECRDKGETCDIKVCAECGDTVS